MYYVNGLTHLGRTGAVLWGRYGRLGVVKQALFLVNEHPSSFPALSQVSHVEKDMVALVVVRGYRFFSVGIHRRRGAEANRQTVEQSNMRRDKQSNRQTGKHAQRQTNRRTSRSPAFFFFIHPPLWSINCFATTSAGKGSLRLTSSKGLLSRPRSDFSSPRSLPFTSLVCATLPPVPAVPLSEWGGCGGRSGGNLLLVRLRMPPKLERN